jgi:hypothetical protein
VKDVKSTAEGTTVKAMKDGKPVTLVVSAAARSKNETEFEE